MATVAELNVKIGADLRDFNSKMQGLQAKLAPIGESFKSFGRSASLYVTGPLVAAGAGLIKMASDAEEMQTKFNTVFRNTGEGVTNRLQEFGDAVGRSVFELKGMASQLGDTLKPMGFTEEAAAALAVDLTKLATDLSSFNNMPMDEALRRLQGTLVGSHENALAFGVVINENTLKAQMLEDGTADLTGAMFEQAKVQARINLLMQGTVDAQGDAERTAEGFANKMRALQASVKDVAVQLGDRLLPIATNIVNKFTDMVAWVGQLSDRNQNLIMIIGGVAAAIGPLSVAIGFLITTLSPWSVAIAAVIAAGTALVVNWDSIKQWVDTNFPLLASGIRIAVDVIVGLFEMLWTNFKAAWDQIVNYFATVIDVVVGMAGVFFDVFTGDWSGAWNGIKEVFGRIWDGITEAFSIALQQIKDLMPDFVQKWFGWTEDVKKDTVKISTALVETADTADDTAKSFSSSGGLQQELSSFTNRLNNSVAPAVQTVKTELEEVQEPARAFADDLSKVSARGLDVSSTLDPAAVTLRTLGEEIETADENAQSFSGTMREFGSGFMQSVSGFEVLFGNIGGSFGKLLDTTQILVNQTLPAIKTLIGGIDSALGAFGINLERQFYALAGFAGGYGQLLGMAGVAGVFGTALFGEGGLFGPSSPTPWERMGISREEWMAIQVNSGANASYIQALTGGGSGITGLVGGFGGGLDFTNPWLTGGGGGQPAMITLNIDSRTIAEAILPAMEREIELNIG